MQGTARKDRHGDRSDAELAGGISTTPPEWMGEYGKAKYIELTTDSRYSRALAPKDEPMVIVFCTLWDRFVRGEKAEGEELTSTGLMVFVNLGAKLGANPSDGTKLRMPEPEKAASPWAAIRNTSNGA